MVAARFATLVVVCVLSCVCSGLRPVPSCNTDFEGRNGTMAAGRCASKQATKRMIKVSSGAGERGKEGEWQARRSHET